MTGDRPSSFGPTPATLSGHRPGGFLSSPAIAELHRALASELSTALNRQPSCGTLYELIRPGLLAGQGPLPGGEAGAGSLPALLCLLSCQAGAGCWAPALPAAACLELLSALDAGAGMGTPAGHAAGRSPAHTQALNVHDALHALAKRSLLASADAPPGVLLDLAERLDGAILLMAEARTQLLRATAAAIGAPASPHVPRSSARQLTPTEKHAQCHPERRAKGPLSDRVRDASLDALHANEAAFDITRGGPLADDVPQRDSPAIPAAANALAPSPADAALPLYAADRLAGFGAYAGARLAAKAVETALAYARFGEAIAAAVSLRRVPTPVPSEPGSNARRIVAYHRQALAALAEAAVPPAAQRPLRDLAAALLFEG